MGKLRQTALVLGEGPTEFFYFKSLCDVFKRLTIKPDYPKHTNIKELELKIEEGISMGYNHIFCVIDMDTKDEEPERTQYQKLKVNIYILVHQDHIIMIVSRKLKFPIFIDHMKYFIIFWKNYLRQVKKHLILLS